MKALILGALIALTPVPVAAQDIPLQNIEIPQKQDLVAVANICMGIATKKVTVQQVVNELKLDTLDKQQGFVYTCSVYFQGISDGIRLNTQRQSQEHQRELPEAATS